MSRNWGYLILHGSLVAGVVATKFDAVMISVAIIVAIFSNLGNSSLSSPYSAYSIFNKGCQYLLGDARADALDRQIRGAQRHVAGAESSRGHESGTEMTDIPSKYTNRPCPCGSGLKAKKCHGAVGRNTQRSTQKRTSENPTDTRDSDTWGFEVLG